MSDEWVYCLGIKAFGWCHYNPLQPGIAYFSIGEAIASIALLFAFFQLATPTSRFRLAVRPTMKWVALGLFVLAFFCVVGAAMIPSVLGYVIPVVGFPIFWEVLAGLLVVSGVSLLGFIYARPASFTKRSFKPYFYACSRTISSGDEHELRLLAAEVSHAAYAIVDAAKRFDREMGQANHAADRERIAKSISGYAAPLLDLFSDERFARAMVEAAPMGAARFLEFLGQGPTDNQVGYSFVEQVVRQALLSENSMLHKEEELYGLGHFKWFTRTVFGNYRLVSSAYRPLNAWDGVGDEYTTPNVIEKYGRALKMAVGAYFETGPHYGSPVALLSAITNFAMVAMAKAISLKNLSTNEVHGSQAYAVLRKISFVLYDIVIAVIEHDNQLPEYSLNASAYKPLHDPSIYGAVAYGIYEFLEKLARAEGHDNEVRWIALTLWMTVDPISKEQPSRAILEIQKRLFLHLQKKVSQNLDVGGYPMLTKLLILLIGLHDTSGQDQQSLGFMTVELHTQLREKFAAAYAANKETAEDMLPAEVHFDVDTNELVYVRAFSKGETRETRFKVNPLPAQPSA